MEESGGRKKFKRRKAKTTQNPRDRPNDAKQIEKADR
jgi:hypothetical protein